MIKSIYKKIVPEKQRLQVRLLLRKLTYRMYSGDQYHCNCCDKHFKMFLPKGHGNKKRPNAQCPYCDAVERTRLLDFYLENEIKIYEKTGIKMLHIAPEKGLFDKLSKLDIEYIDGDINLAMARNIVDLTDIKYEDNYFDLIICSHVLGHIPDESKAISEMKRVLKPDGVALVMTLINLDAATTFEDKNIISEEERLKNYGEPDLVRLHGLGFGDRLRREGFKVTKIDYRKEMSEEILAKNSLGNGERELIFKCEK